MILCILKKRTNVSSFRYGISYFDIKRISRLHSSSNAEGGRISSAVADKKLVSRTMNREKEMEVLETNSVKGTRDFYPEDLRLRSWLFDNWREVSKSFGFSEYDCPVLENEALYTRKSGEEVTSQLYCFEDKGGRRLSLRPEMTPSLARMVMSKKGGLTLPIKWYSIPQCWRYERMTRGRRREHYQWNMDIWGVPEVTAETELLAAMVSFFKKVGLSSEDVGIKINSRLVIAEVLTELGIPEEKFAATCVLIDKLEKVPLQAIQADLEQLGLSSSIVEKLTRTLSEKSVESLSSVLSPDSKAITQLNQIFQLCHAYGISDWVLFDASIVRGLAYYTGIVFEAFDRKGQLRAIAGGGRYDNLLQSFGAESIPAVGFGFGDAVIVELLKDRKLLPTFTNSGIDIVVYALDRDLYNVAIQTTALLRSTGQSVDLILQLNKKPKWVFKNADKKQAKYVLIVAPDEYQRGEVSIKNLINGEQTNIEIDSLLTWSQENNNNNER